MSINLFNTKYSQMLKQALDVYGKQHKAIAKNVANVNNPKYIRVNTDFSQVLKSKVDLSNVKTTSAKHIASSKNGMVKTVNKMDKKENKVDLPREMTALAENQIRYDFVARMLGRYYGGLSKSITGDN